MTLQETLGALDPTSPEDRRRALEAAHGLVERHIAPAATLLRSAPGSEHRAFDLDALAGHELPGLTLGLLARRFPDLDHPPGDAAFAEALDDLGVEVSDAARRSALLRAWTAQRAVQLVRELVSRLREGAPADPMQAELERADLARLRDAPLPTLDRKWIELTLAAPAWDADPPGA